MKKILRRFKSPIVIIQIISIIGSIICAVTPQLQGIIDKIVYSITIIVNVIAGVNNPDSKESL